MRIIAIANQKGGVGKTTTTVNLAGALAQRGRQVIVVDLDPQAHLTTFLGVDPAAIAASSYDVLIHNRPLAECLRDVRPRIRLLGASLELAAAEQELVSVVGREIILRHALAGYDQPCDYILIDCPPSLGLLTLNALGAAQEVFITLQPHFLSLQGLSQLLETVLLVRHRINPPLEVTGLLLCLYDARTSLSGEIVADIERFFAQPQQQNCPWRHAQIFHTRIRRNIKLAESPSHGQTIFEYEPHCNGAEDYLALALEVEGVSAATVPPPVNPVAANAAAAEPTTPPVAPLQEQPS
jgi:chromosome partitioning protein